jgi:hypothetical protein
VQKPYQKWIEFLYGPIFKVIGFFYRVYSANRSRVEQFKGNEKVSSVIKLMTVLVLFGWILIWYLADDNNQTSLLDEVKQSIGIDNTASDQ